VTERRSVRVDRAFFELLDDQLGEDRGPNGEPSAGDFLLVDLPLIAEAFATKFESLAMPEPEHPEFRSLVMSALLVPSVLVTGVLGADDVVTLLSVRIDLDLPWE
jgi:hypothetical protein